MRQARGVLPHKQDKVIKNPRADALIILVTLRSDLDASGAAAWLDKIDAAIVKLRQVNGDGDRVATVAVGFAPTFFTPAAGARFADLPLPAGFKSLPAVPDGAPVTADVAFYVMATYEAVAAEFVTDLWATRPDVAAIQIERGYQRRDESEPFGYRDGVRNIHRDKRGEVAFIDRDKLPEEPPWADRGTYMTYMRIRQNVDQFAALSADAQDAAMGRDRSGRRLDLPEGTDPHAEGPISGDSPPLASHVRKAGPRTDDSVAILRRGVPYLEAGADGTVQQGLQFVSFQASLDQFETVFNRWMLNTQFPPPGPARRDELIEQGLITIERFGFYFVPGDDDTPLSARLLHAAEPEPKAKKGRVHVRKRVVDTVGTEVMGDLANFTFRVVDHAGNVIGAEFTTNAAGHTHSDELPVGVPLRLEESAASGTQPAAAVDFQLDSPHLVIEFTNTIQAGTTYGR